MPSQGRKRAAGISVLSAQERTKSTIWSRVSWGTQQALRVPHFFFFLGEGLHELGHDFVLARELGLELLDLGLLGVFDGLGLAAAAIAGEGEMPVLEELLEPGVKLVGVELVLIAQVRDRDLVEKMTLEDGDLLGAREMTTRLAAVHEETSVQVKLTQTERWSRFD